MEARKHRLSHRRLSKFTFSALKNDRQNVKTDSDFNLVPIINDETRKKMQQSNISSYFKQLFRYVSDRMVLNEKKYTELQRGLYVLLKGKLCYTWTNKKHDIQRKEHLFNLSKTGIFFFYSDPILQDKQIQQNQCFPIEKPFSIFQCDSDSCYTLEDCILLKIENEVREKTSFDELYQYRKNIIESCHIDGEINTNNTLFTVNLKLHHTFKTYQYQFHSRIQFQTLAVVESGVLIPIKQDLMKITTSYFQMEQYSVLFPGVGYQVYSTKAKIIAIQNNPTLYYIHQDLINAHKLLKMRAQNIFRSLSVNRMDRTACNSVHNARTPSEITSKMNKFQANNQRKKLTNISKRYQNQLIITMQTCKQSLSFSEKQTQQLKNSGDKYRRPNILFDYSEYCSNKSLKKFNNAFLENEGYFFPREGQNEVKERKTQNCLMRRYKYFSRELYEKFVGTRQFEVRKGSAASVVRKSQCYFDSEL